jgi:hypothetical protein
MRNFVTAAAAALALTLGVASPAVADHNYPYQGGYPNQNQYQYQGQNPYADDDRYSQDRFDQQYRYQKPMSQRKLIRALAYQGFYGVRGLQRTRSAWSYRAFAFDRSGRAVMVSVNAFNGRVTNVRYV